MALLKQWRDMAYSETANKGDLQRLWSDYFLKEKEIYAQLLKEPDTLVEGTVKELAEKYGIDIMTMTGFLDGINSVIILHSCRSTSYTSYRCRRDRDRSDMRQR